MPALVRSTPVLASLLLPVCACSLTLQTAKPGLTPAQQPECESGVTKPSVDYVGAAVLGFLGVALAAFQQGDRQCDGPQECPLFDHGTLTRTAIVSGALLASAIRGTVVVHQCSVLKARHIAWVRATTGRPPIGEKPGFSPPGDPVCAQWKDKLSRAKTTGEKLEIVHQRPKQCE